MKEDFTTYRKFTDQESAEDVCKLLKDNGIEYELSDSSHTYLKVIGYSQIDPGIVINIKSNDFKKADQILDSYYLKQIENVDKSHYVFEFSDDELKEIVRNPYDWGTLDFHLAKKLLKDKGFEFSENYIEDRKSEKIKELSQTKEVSTYKLILGYIFSIILPPVGLIIGLLIVNTKNVLPNGQKLHAYTTKSRTQGQIIITISTIWATIIILNIMLRN